MKRKKQFDIISIGDATLDVFLDVQEASLRRDAKKGRRQICFNYADKVPVQGIVYAPGGNALNNAVGSKRLGLKSALYSVLGDDESGHVLMKRLREEKVNRDLVKVNPKKRTNYATVINFKGDRTILSYHEERKYIFPKLPDTKWIYFTSMGKGHQHFYPKIVSHIKKSGVKLAFNPGSRQIALGAKKLLRVMKISEVLLVNRDEAEELVGKRIKDTKKLVMKLSEFGQRVTVVTDGSRGAYAYDSEVMYFLKTIKAPVVERTGTGDAFSTGFVSALIYGYQISDAMRWGSVNATYVLQKIGAEEGLLTEKEMTKLLKKHKNNQPQII